MRTKSQARYHSITTDECPKGRNSCLVFIVLICISSITFVKQYRYKLDTKNTASNHASRVPYLFIRSTRRGLVTAKLRLAVETTSQRNETVSWREGTPEACTVLTILQALDLNPAGVPGSVARQFTCYHKGDRFGSEQLPLLA
jgi:hypothetical protein